MILNKYTLLNKRTFYTDIFSIAPQQLLSVLLCDVRKTGAYCFGKNLKANNRMGFGKTPEQIEKKRLILSEIEQKTRLALFLKQTVVEFYNEYKPNLLVCKNEHRLSASNSSIKTMGRYAQVEKTAQTIVVSLLDKMNLTNTIEIKNKPP